MNATRLHDDNDPYLQFLRERIDRTFYLFPYPGNSGDVLILLGTQHLLARLGIRTTVDPRKADVIVTPGGNPTMWPTISVNRWPDLARRSPRAEMVIGPAGYRIGHSDWASVLNDPAMRFTGVFARDPQSFATLRNAVTDARVTVALSHDPALALLDSEMIRQHRDAATQEYDLLAFRDDHEGASREWSWHSTIPMPGRMRRLLMRRHVQAARRRKYAWASHHAPSPQLPQLRNDASRQTLEVFLELVRSARVVHTDRLHTMLAGVLLGKKVIGYGTSYGKLQGIHGHSLAPWADVEFAQVR